MKKYLTIIIIISLSTFSCSKKEVINCTSISNNEYLFKKNGIEYYIVNGNLASLTNNKEYYTVVFEENNINKISSIHFGKSNGDPLKEIEFNSNKISEYSVFNYKENEFIKYSIKNKDTTIQVYYYIESYDTYKLIHHLTIQDNRDTVNYFFYIKNKNGFEIKTDLTPFSLSNPFIDTIELTFFDDKQDLISYGESDEGVRNYLLLNNGVDKKISIDDLFLETKSDSIIGYSWTTYNKKNDYPYYYKLFIMKGDLLQKINENRNNLINDSKLDPMKMIPGNQIENLIIESKMYELNRGILKKKEVKFVFQ